MSEGKIFGLAELSDKLVGPIADGHKTMPERALRRHNVINQGTR